MESEAVKRTPLTATGASTIHPKRQNISFGRWAMPVMAVKMKDPDPLDRKRAVQSLCDYCFDSRRAASKEFESVVPQLKSLSEDEDKEVRLKVAECFGAISATAAGRVMFEKHNFYTEILKLFEDPDENIRQAAITAIHRASLSPVGAESLVREGAIEKLLRSIPQEDDIVIVPLLQALHLCCLVNSEEALELNGLETLIPLLKRSDRKLRQRAGVVIKDLTIEATGRNRAVQLSAIPPLLELCLDESDLVKAKALSALMMISNAKAGKYEALECEALEKILPLVKSESVEVRLNAIKVLTALGEAPEGRRELLKYYRMLLRLFNDSYEEVQNAAKKLITVVTFEP